MKICHLPEVVACGLCTGCGACAAVCKKQSVTLVDLEEIGIRPALDSKICAGCHYCLNFCPGYQLDGDLNHDGHLDPIGGRIRAVYEGYAKRKELRYRAASGGFLTALALYCLEKESMESVIHTGMAPLKPYQNTTVISHNYQELIEHCGSRYAPSAPCEALSYIEQQDKKVVFIGKPCDVATVAKLMQQRPELAEKIGLLLSIFCSGVPSTLATKRLIERLDVKLAEVTAVHYRGFGWPGSFRITSKEKQLIYPYLSSWKELREGRPWRCHICPDGLGQLADISCGDAWLRYHKETPVDGFSSALIRSKKGEEIFKKAITEGYLYVELSSLERVMKANQSLLKRRQQLYGRLQVFRCFGIPIPRYQNFSLRENWQNYNSFRMRLRIILKALRVAFRKFGKCRVSGRHH